jgi:hypothetical protein
VASARGRGENLWVARSEKWRRVPIATSGGGTVGVLVGHAHWFTLEENSAGLGLGLIPNGSGPHF